MSSDPPDAEVEPIAVVAACSLRGDASDPQLARLPIDLAALGIPPAQAGPMSRMQVLMLEAARRCLAGEVATRLPGQATDVLVALPGGLDRQYRNALRVEASRYVDVVRQLLLASRTPQLADLAAAQLRERVLLDFGASPHDRVGEMASTIPARIAATFALRGRTLALEAAEAGAHAALDHAMTCLRGGSAEAALVVAGQRSESSFAEALRSAKRLQLGSEPAAPELARVTALLLKTRSGAQRAGDPVLAELLDCRWEQTSRPGVLRPPATHRSAGGLSRTGDLTTVHELIDEFGDLPGETGTVTAETVTGARAELVLRPPEPVRRAAVSQPRTRPVPVAVVAQGALFAGVDDAEQFWALVTGSQDALSPLPAEIFDRELYLRPGQLRLDCSYTDLGGHVRAPRQPPPGVVIPPARYAALDVTHRAVLQVAAAMFAECSPRLAGRGLIALGSTLCPSSARRAHALNNLGELAGLLREIPALAELAADELTDLAERSLRLADQPVEPTAYLADGVLASGAAALVANEFRLAAVPVAIEAACASTLAAIDLAMQALAAGRIDYAVVGGVEFPCTERDLVLCSALGLLSGTRMTPFDEAADGFTPGDGCALFVLKRLPDALAATDRILGVLRGSGAANDAASLIAPDRDGQVLAMRRAFTGLDYGPEAVDYLEAHGTGTKVGDRVEFEAVAEVYGGSRASRPLAVGSVKSFLGHTFAAAGGAGLLRALGALRTATIPPTANLTRLSPVLRPDDIPAVVGTRPTPWPPPAGRPRRAAVSSFGTGGINYHLLVEEHLPQ